MASTAKVLFPSSPAARDAQVVHAVPSPAARRAGWGWFQFLRDTLGGALLLAVWIALWTVTWAAVAGPLSPARDAAARAAVTSLEGT